MTASALAGLSRQRADYARGWSATSSFFAAEGHYAWMAEQLAGSRRVLEIGCGVGFSSAALCAAGHELVALDENPACVRATCARLREAGVPARPLLRGRPVAGRDGRYAIRYLPMPADAPPAGLVVEGDAMNDGTLLAWLVNGPCFDGMACWLVGTHHARGQNLCLEGLGITSAAGLRLALHRQVYALAGRVLRPGGRLSIIDRMQKPATAALEAEIAASHARLAHGTGMRPQAPAYRCYREPETGTKMTATGGFDSTRLALVSVTSLKD